MQRILIDNSVYERLPGELAFLCSSFQGRERDLILLSSLGVLSNCMPNVYGYYANEKVYPHLYMMVIAPPASGKGVIKQARLLIDKIHQKVLGETVSEWSKCQDENKGKRKEDKVVCPPIQVKILPANISSAEMYAHLARSEDGLLIIESEADTMSKMLKLDYGDYSDVLRKAFHHEPISISRKTDQLFLEIAEPKLAMVISGTPNQLQPLIISKENGLFSRFAIYSFDEIQEFKNVFELQNRRPKEMFENIGEEVFELYNQLAFSEGVEFTLSDTQKQRFHNEIIPIRQEVLENFDHSFVSNVHRHGLILFRIAMVLSVIRHRNQTFDTQVLVCCDEDFEIAVDITKTLLDHCKYVFSSMTDGVISIIDQKFLDGLESSFTRQEAIAFGDTLGIPVRTVDDKLRQLRTKKIIKRAAQGKYIKRM